LESSKREKIESFLEPFNYKKDKFHVVIKKFKKKTNAVLNIIIDEEGYIIHSDGDISLDSIDKKYLGIYTEIITTFEENVELQDLQSNLEVNSYYEKGKFFLHNFICLAEQLSEEKSIHGILPYLLDLSCILPDFKRKDANILKCFLSNKTHPHKECLLIQ